MTYCKVYFEDGNSFITSINGTKKEIEEYYLNNTFNLGTEGDKMVKCIRCDVAKKYKATFTGRQLGAIGIFYEITDTVEGLNEDDANLNLYDKYEHIMHLKLEEVQ